MVSISREPVALISDKFLSFTVDMAQVVGRDWWHPDTRRIWSLTGANHTEPFDFSRKRLRNMAKNLAPAFLKIGGTKSDDVFYAVDSKNPGKDYGSVLTMDMWGSINDFAKECGLDLFFSINAGKGPRKNKQWTGDNAREFLEYSKEKGYEIPVFGFGNEPNGYIIKGLNWFVSGRQYARDVIKVRELIDELYPGSRLAAGSSSFWPYLGEFFPVMRQFLKNNTSKVDIVAWHHYPQQSSRIPFATRRAKPFLLLDPKKLDAVSRWAAKVESWKEKYSPSSALWLAETGHAQAGGEPGLSDTFVSGFWWLDQLGLLAKKGQEVVVRQTLSGAHYGLIDDESLDPNPDYWNSVLWKMLMGTKVYDAESKEDIRCYAHSARDEKSIVLLLLNLDKEYSKKIDLGNTLPKEVFMLSSDDLFGRNVFLNGKLLRISEDGTLPDLLPVETTEESIELKPTSYAFIRFLKNTSPE
ncbi:hypothetical protein GF343_04925 [Candidatus Woesearchaeota archaeon]|nr:hypothetical protein [Candidatus Woesearchaeota archaeon]